MNAFFRAWPLWLALLPLVGYAQTGARLDPADPSMAVPTTKYDSAFGDYRPYKDQKVGPWKQVLDEVAGVPGAAGHTGHGGRAMSGDMPGMAHDMPGTKHDMSAMNPEPGKASPMAPNSQGGQATAPPAAAAPSGNSDTKGVVKAINRADGKLTLKHGPIPKLDMPGMTMVFRVNDPKLLDQIKEGDEIGVTVDRTGGALTITGIQK